MDAARGSPEGRDLALREQNRWSGGRLRALVGEVRALPRNARLLLAASCVGTLPAGIMSIYYPLYLHHLGWHAVHIGGLFTLAGVSAAIVMLCVGPLVDRLGRVPFLLAGAALPILGYTIFTLSTSHWWVLLGSLLSAVGVAGGLAGALSTDSFMPLLSEAVSPEQRTRVLSWVQCGSAGGMAVGTLLTGVPALLAGAHLAGGVVAERLPFVLCLAAALASTALVLPLASTTLPPAPRAEPRGGEHRSADVRAALPLILKIAVFFSLQGAGLGLIGQLLPLWLTERFHVSTGALIPWFAAAQLAAAGGALPVPALARRWSTARVILVSSIPAVPLLIGVPLAPLLPVAGLCLALRGVALAIQAPAQQSFLQGCVPQEIRGTATSVAMGGWSLAAAILPLPAGYLLDRHLLAWPFVLGIACYIAAIVVFWALLRRTALPEEESCA